MVGAVALLFAVAIEVPEVGMWAMYALPASLVISLGYILVRRWKEQPPTTLNLDGSRDAGRTTSEPESPQKGLTEPRRPFHDAVASC